MTRTNRWLLVAILTMGAATTATVTGIRTMTNPADLSSESMTRGAQTFLAGFVGMHLAVLPLARASSCVD